MIDVFSRMIVGWQLAANMRTTLVLDALRMALGLRAPGADVTLVHHSDTGSDRHAPQLLIVRRQRRAPHHPTRQLINQPNREQLTTRFGDGNHRHQRSRQAITARGNYYAMWQCIWVCQRDSIDCVKSDARRVSGTTREALRERGVKMVLAGRTHAVVAQSLGVHLRTVSLWMARHQLRGFEGLREGRRGRRSREQMALTDAQQAELIRLMKGTNPDQLQIPGVLWSRQAVKALIERRFGLGLSRQTVGVYLRRWGFSGKKPQRRWLEQDPERVRVWLQDEFPAIQARARREGARMLFGDEMGVRAGQTAGKSYAPIGERAIVPLTGKRFSANVISAIGADGTLVFEIFEGSCDEIRFLDFLDKLLEHFPERKIFLIVDNASFHKSPAVEYWLLDHPRMELFYLPPYAPELNPDELLNQDVHTHVARRRPSNLAKLVTLTVEYLATRTSEIVSKYFDGEYVAYAK